MTIQETFDSTKTPLNDILASIEKGKIQLPDFQRGWVWDDDRIKSLLASIAMSYPIGAIMLLETGNPDVRFKPRPIQGATDHKTEPESFILDGQQRLTTLFQTLFSNQIVETRDQKQNSIKRWYYFDIKTALSPDVDVSDAIISIQEEKRITRDFGREVVRSLVSAEEEYANLAFPINQSLKATDWFNGYMSYWNYDQEKIKIFQSFQQNILKRIESYQLPVIKMLKHNPKDAVCQVFEKVNTGGVSLTVFELLTATYAADEYNLREDWNKRYFEFKKEDITSGFSSNELLQAISLYSTLQRKQDAIDRGVSADNLPAVSCKRKDVLKIDLETYKKWADPASKAFELAGRLLKRNKIFKSRDLPYSTQLVPLSVILGLLGNQGESDGVKQKVLRWFWCGVLGELYGGAIETRFAKDVVEVIDWINGGDEPSTVRDAYFAENRLGSLKSRNSAAYKGIFILQLQNGAKDFKTGDEIEWTNYYDEGIDIHHIFPKKWCEDHGIAPAIYNSIVNKTPLALRTNRLIGGRAPSLYLQTLRRQAEIDESRIEEILQSHFIRRPLLEQDDFKGFLKDRKEKLIQAIEKAMGKTVHFTNEVYDEELENTELFEMISPGANETHQEIDDNEVEDEAGIDSSGNREYWIKKRSEKSIQLAEQLIELLSEDGHDYAMVYKKSHIKLNRDGDILPFVRLRPWKKFIAFILEAPQSPEIDTIISTNDLEDIGYNKITGRYRVRVRNNELESKREALRELFQAIQRSHS